MTSPHRHRLLVVDDEPDLRTLYEITLAREGYDVECAATLGEASQALSSGGFQAIITDMRLPDGSGLDLLRQLDRAGGAERAIVITAYGSAENAVEALKAGAFDYLTKPVDLRQFRAVVASAVGRPVDLGGIAEAGIPPAVTRDRRSVMVGRRAVERLVGDSSSMQQIRSLVQRVARSMAPVLVVGESGTGKELVARAIHESSSRASQPFVAVNCGAIPDALLEAEFFGYRKGAFTGALEDRVGFFQAAAGGTLFLDEIGDLPLLMQSKLLRVIQERAARPLGSTAEVSTDVRIISATNRDLGVEVQAGRFRRDLFYRLDVIRIALPPLRERLEDLPSICSALLDRIAREAGTDSVPRITAHALEHLAQQRFPGNVRELENLLHRALALSASEEIDVSDVDLPQAEVCPPDVDILRKSAPAAAASKALSEHAATTRRFDGPLPVDLAAYLDGVERQILEEALMRHRYNRTAAGASLGMSLRQIRYRMARLGIHAGSDPVDPLPTS